MCDGLSFINTTQKTSEKNVSMPRMDEKKLHTWEFQLKRSSRNMRCELLQKMFTGKTTECSKHLRHTAIEKNILSEPNRCISQIPLKYIKLVIVKILCILVLCSFNFYVKITWPLPPPKQNSLQQYNSPHQNGGSVACPKPQLKLSPLIQNRVRQDYLPESYARHLPSYQKCHKIVAPTTNRCGLFPLPLKLYGKP